MGRKGKSTKKAKAGEERGNFRGNKEQIEAFIAANPRCTYEEIAFHFGGTVSGAYYALRKFEIKKPESGLDYGALRQLLLERPGLTIPQAQEIFGGNEAALRYAAKKMGLTFTPTPRGSRTPRVNPDTVDTRPLTPEAVDLLLPALQNSGERPPAEMGADTVEEGVLPPSIETGEGSKPLTQTVADWTIEIEKLSEESRVILALLRRHAGNGPLPFDQFWESVLREMKPFKAVTALTGLRRSGILTQMNIVSDPEKDTLFNYSISDYGF